jgi:hypothetical protein
MHYLKRKKKKKFFYFVELTTNIGYFPLPPRLKMNHQSISYADILTHGHGHTFSKV